MKTLIVAGALVLFVSIIYVAFGKTEGAEEKGTQDVMNEYFITTASESAARVERALLDPPSEDVSDLLIVPLVEADSDQDQKDYLPDPGTDWALFARFENGRRLDGAEVLAAVGNEWRRLHGSPQVYGKAVDDGHWTYLIAGDAPKFFSELAFGWRLGPDFEDPSRLVAAEELLRYRESLSRLLSQFGSVTMESSVTPSEAAARAQELRRVVDTCDGWAVIVLASPEGGAYEGRVVWDVMLSLGLSWGDMDLFHWPNRSPIGDDSLFSVETSTSPGYFIPEAVAAGDVQPADLVFSYSIPRSADPVAVFHSMSAAAMYAQRRLGGSLLDGSGNPFDEDFVLEEIESVVADLEAAGFVPGRGSTLHLF